MRIRTAPPTLSALDLYLSPNRLPAFTPTAEQAKVTQPIDRAAGIMDTFMKAKVTPTAKASMLVATAKANIAGAAMFASDSLPPQRIP